MIRTYLNKVFTNDMIGISCYRNEMDMIRLGFGMKKIDNQKVIAMYEFHIQTDFRLIDNNSIVLCASMIFLDSDGTEFNNTAKNWTKKNLPAKVDSFEVNKWGDLIINLQDDKCIQVYNAYQDSEERELWRVMEVGSDKKHVVINNHSMRNLMFKNN